MSNCNCTEHCSCCRVNCDHCYCQTVYVAEVEHDACCKCYDRTKSEVHVCPTVTWDYTTVYPQTSTTTHTDIGDDITLTTTSGSSCACGDNICSSD